MPKLFDRVKVNVATVGFGSLTFGPAASPVFMTPLEAGAVDGDTIRYLLVEGSDFEEGIGSIFSSGTQMNRQTITRSKIGGVVGNAKMNLTGTAALSIVASSADMLNPANNLSDVADKPASLGNLGGMAKANNLSDVASKIAAMDSLSVHGADIPSAALLNLDAATGNYVRVTGSTTITAITLSDGRQRTVYCTGSPLFQNGANLAMPFGQNLQVSPGAVLVFVADGAVVRCTDYQAATQNDAQTTIGAASAGGLINKFRNATLDMWQRGTSLTTAGGYTADGWYVAPTGANVTVTQVAGRLLSTYSLRVTGNTGVTDVQVFQRIESIIAAPLSSQTVTVQAWVYNNTGALITPTLTVLHPNAADNYGTYTIDLNNGVLQSCPNGAWTRLAYTFTAPAAAANGLQVNFDFGNNFGSNAKFVQIAELDIRATPVAPVGLNAAPPPPEMRAGPIEETFNLRYARKSYAIGAPPGSPIAGGSGGVSVGTGSSAAGVAIHERFVPRMRAAPTLIFFDDAGAPNAVSYYASGWRNSGPYTLFVSNDNGFTVQCTTGATQISASYLATAEL